jgi:siroheme decarboxylase
MNANKKILIALGDPLPIVSAPFAQMASRAGLQERSLLALLRREKKEGRIRRMGAVLNQRRLGLRANALVAWDVPGKRINEAGRHFSRYHQVSHCYARRPYPEWPYTIYTMVHARGKPEILRLVKKMSRASRVPGYRVLSTVKELKKEKMNFARVLQ